MRTEFFEASIDDPARRAEVTDTGIHELEADDVAAAVLYAVEAPSHVSVATVELHPTEQVYGGLSFAPIG